MTRYIQDWDWRDTVALIAIVAIMVALSFYARKIGYEKGYHDGKLNEPYWDSFKL